MAGHLPTQPIISRDALIEIADSRLAETRALVNAKHWAGAVYLGGYAVECYLKAAICFTLHWDGLLPMFKTHDLAGLLRFTGLEPSLREKSPVRQSFVTVVGLWDMYGDETIRYRRPIEVDSATATRFLACLEDSETGVIPWLRKTIP